MEKHNTLITHPQQLDLKILIVDDEEDACNNLKNLLLQFDDPRIHISGIAHNTFEAERQIQAIKPNVIFLDIEMPNENAFQFIERTMPVEFEVVFVTAYDEFAVNAFKLNAVDYILKPIAITDLQRAIHGLQKRLHYKSIFDHDLPFGQLFKNLKDRATPQQIVLKKNSTSEIVDIRHILFIEAMRSYSKIYYLKGNVEKDAIASYSISDYEDMLPQPPFFRIHKSYLVNCVYAKQIIQQSHTVVLNEKHRLSISTRKLTDFLKFIKANTF